MSVGCTIFTYAIDSMLSELVLLRTKIDITCSVQQFSVCPLLTLTVIFNTQYSRF
jgi:hypothetical protein